LADSEPCSAALSSREMVLLMSRLAAPRRGRRRLALSPNSGPTHRLMQEKLEAARDRTLHWLRRTPVRTFILYPLIVIVFELALRQGRLIFVRWGAPLLFWEYLQYLYVGSYRLPRADRS
jgi:hypothetical protein